MRDVDAPLGYTSKGCIPIEVLPVPNECTISLQITAVFRLQMYTQSQNKHTMNSSASPVTQGKGQVTPAGSYWNGVFAHCHQHHRQNEIHYKVHLSTLFRRGNTTFYGAFHLRLSVSTLLPKRNTTFHSAFLLRLSVGTGSFLLRLSVGMGCTSTSVHPFDM